MKTEQQKSKMKEIASFTFQNVSQEIENYENRTAKALLNLDFKGDPVQVKSMNDLLDSNQINQIIIASIISVIDKRLYPMKKLQYTASLSIAKQFIKLINFIQNFFKMIDTSKILDMKREGCYSKYLVNCNKLMTQIQILDKYHNKSTDEIQNQKMTSNMYFKFPLLQAKLKDINKIIIR